MHESSVLNMVALQKVHAVLIIEIYAYLMQVCISVGSCLFFLYGSHKKYICGLVAALCSTRNWVMCLSVDKMKVH